MSWALAASWLTVAGSLLLIFGTGAQAWANLTEYRDLFNNTSREAKQAFERLNPVLQSIMLGGGWHAGEPGIWGAAARIPLAFLMILGIPLKMAAIREAGGEETARLARLLRQAAVWSILMVGSVLIMAAVTIQLVLSYA